MACERLWQFYLSDKALIPIPRPRKVSPLERTFLIKVRNKSVEKTKCLKFPPGQELAQIFLAYEIILQNLTKRESSDFSLFAFLCFEYSSRIIVLDCIIINFRALFKTV